MCKARHLLVFWRRRRPRFSLIHEALSPSPSSQVHQTKLIECCLKRITTHFYCKICDEKKKDNLIKTN